MNINNQLIILSILILIVIFITYTKSFKNDIPNCHGYITNVYLYILLGLLLIGYILTFIEKRKYPITFTKSIIYFLISIVLIFLMFYIPDNYVIIHHILWLLFLICISINLYHIWKYSIYSRVLTSTIIILIIIFTLLTFISFVKPDLIDLKWGNTLLLLLFIGLLAWIIPLFFNNGKNMTLYYKFLSAFFVFLFMILIIYDTRLLKIKAETCVLPNYPRDSLSLILDIINLFNNLIFLQS